MPLAVYLDKRADREHFDPEDWPRIAGDHPLLREATDMELALGLQFGDLILFHPHVVNGPPEPLIAYWHEGFIGITLPLRDHAEYIIALAESLDCRILNDHLDVLYDSADDVDTLPDYLFSIAERTVACRETNRRRVQGAPTVKMVAPPVETFKDLRIPFPLFEGPAADSKEYVGIHQCGLCDEPDQHCFQLGIGCDLICTCPECGHKNALDADGRIDGVCSSCGTPIAFPEFPDNLRLCYSCLRTGKAAITKNTERGMVSFAYLDHNAKDLLELLRTPTYSSIQGEHWLFCCDQPMIFAGEWQQDDFRRAAPDGVDPEEFFNTVVDDVCPGLWEDRLHDITAVYVFFCEHCRKYRAHWDMA